MAKDLTTSAISRQNILNNPEEYKKLLDLSKKDNLRRTLVIKKNVRLADSE